MSSFNSKISKNRVMHMIWHLLCVALALWLHHGHWGNYTLDPVTMTQPWGMWANEWYEGIKKWNLTTTKHSTTKQCTYFVWWKAWKYINSWFVDIEMNDTSCYNKTYCTWHLRLPSTHGSDLLKGEPSLCFMTINRCPMSAYLQCFLQ